MVYRNKSMRSNNPLLVTAAALNRAVDPKEPSRITVIRILGDALYTLQESQLKLDHAKSRNPTYFANRSTPPLTRANLDTVSQLRSEHEKGARELFTATINVLIKLPTRGGTLRRRATDLLKIAGKAGGTAVVMKGVNSIREHLTSLKRLTWTESEVTSFEVICNVMNLATVSSCSIAGRDIARESIHFLLSPRIRQKSRRSDLALAIATIVQSFPSHAPPDDRLVDNMLELVLSQSTLKQAETSFGSGLLAAMLVPLLVSRGPDAADKVVNFCTESLNVLPTTTERGIWILAMARAAITARRSTTFQMKKYGTPDATSKFPRQNITSTILPSNIKNENDGSVAWVSNEIFEESLVQVAKVSGFEEGRSDAVIGIAAIIRMWAAALPSNRPTIIPRTFSKLLHKSSSVASLSAWVDAIWLGFLRDLKPSQSADILDSIIPILLESDIRLAASLHICGTILIRHGRCSLRESGLTQEYSTSTNSLIKYTQESLHSNFFTVRLAGVRLMAGIVTALPRTCSMFLTIGLQNLRISDLSLAMKPSATSDVRGSSKVLQYMEEEISPILGHASALVVLFREIIKDSTRVPSELIRPCLADAFALLQPHHASRESGGHGIIIDCIRRRVGWGLINSMVGSDGELQLDQTKIDSLLPAWKRELGSNHHREKQSNVNEQQESGGSTTHPNGLFQENELTFDEFLALSSTRAAALHALYSILKTNPSENLKQCARSVIGYSAVRLVGYLTMCSGSTTSNTAIIGLGLNAIPGDPTFPNESLQGKKQSMAQIFKYLACEAFQTIQCVSIISPSGELGQACFYLSLFLGEEAQKVLGETNSSRFVSTPSQPTSPSDRLHLDTGMTNCRHTLQKYSLITENTLPSSSDFRRLSDIAFDSNQSQDLDLDLTEIAWIFGRNGVDGLQAEKALVMSAKGIAAVFCEDLTGTSSLIESIPRAKLSPPLCGAIGLQMTRQLSRSDLAEINKALAVLQLLARRSLAITGACQKSIASQNRNGLFIPTKPGFSCHLKSWENPGSTLRSMAQSSGWLGWARAFLQEGHVYRVPFQNFHSVALSMLYSTRAVATAVHRELSITGGVKLWNGLMRQVISNVKDNKEASTATQSLVVTSSIATLGALLEAKPEFSKTSINSGGSGKKQKSSDSVKGVEDISTEAINLLIALIESRNSEVQSAAALALSSRSQDVATSSERILSALLRAWAQDRGEQNRMGHFGRAIDETDIWRSSFIHLWHGMGVDDTERSPDFYVPCSQGYGDASIAFTIGAAAVLSSCRLYQWSVSEASYASVKEMSTELVQWIGRNGERARAGGLYGLSSIWAAKTDVARSHVTLEDARKTWGTTSPRALPSLIVHDVPVLPVDSFSLKDMSRISSPLGPFLDEILYHSLTPTETYAASTDLQIAATGAVLEMVRGAGAAKTCENLPRLPESLFGAAEHGIPDTGKLLKIFVHHNAAKRPRYWFGLCRAICLRSERLNYGDKKSVWNVPLSIMCLSAKIAKDAIEISARSCLCHREEKAPVYKEHMKHSCSLGFIRKVLDFVKELLTGKRTDVVLCSEGFSLLESTTNKLLPTLDKVTGDLTEYNPVFESLYRHLDSIEALLNDDKPQTIVIQTAKSITDMIALLITNRWTFDDDKVHRRVTRIENKFQSVLTAPEKAYFQYIDQGQEVGANVFLAVFSHFARFVSAIRAYRLLDAYANTKRYPDDVLRKLLRWYCEEFASHQMGNGEIVLRTQNKSNGTSSIPAYRHKSMRKEYVPSIILGSLSCHENRTSVDSNPPLSHLPNDTSQINGVESERIEPLLLVWFLTQRHNDVSLSFDSVFWSHIRNSLLTYFASANASSSGDCLDTEILTSFAQRNTTGFLQFIERIPVRLSLRPSVLSLTVEILTSILLSFADEDFSACYEDDASSVTRSITSMKTLINNVGFSGVPRSLQLQLIDALFELFCIENKNITSTLCEFVFEVKLQDVLSTCISQFDPKANLQKRISLKLNEMYCNSVQQSSPPHIRLTIALTAILNAIFDNELEDDLRSMILSDRIIETEEGMKTTCLALSLDYEIIVQYLRKVISSASRRSTSSNQAAVIALANGLSDLGTSTISYSIPVALRLSIVAILAEGEDCHWINRVGMVLYSIFLPGLMKELSATTQQEGTVLQKSSTTCDGFFIDMVDKESFSLYSFVSFLHEEERGQGAQFLRFVESTM